ncbi:hypothetical protein [Cupriavidus necator]|uniref:hypothetical protein n=1 Tax=Cupriavidus necator TaxID=106590 RepID=UPI00059C6CF5|nr:hypothetical protein [Cupriavidus necator]MDX6014730.1 hypothetical protein [Cupriavidus necator]
MQGWKSVLGALGGTVAVIAISIFGATSAMTKPYDPSLMASWVQATGSIAAIAGAYLLGLRQERAAYRLQEQAEVREAQRMRDTIRAVAKAGVDRAVAAERLLFTPDLDVNPTPFIFGGVSAIVERIEEARRAMTAIPLHQIGKAEIVLSVSDLTFALADFAETLRETEQEYKRAHAAYESFEAGTYPGRAKLDVNNVNGVYARLCENLVEE